MSFLRNYIGQFLPRLKMRKLRALFSQLQRVSFLSHKCAIIIFEYTACEVLYFLILEYRSLGSLGCRTFCAADWTAEMRPAQRGHWFSVTGTVQVLTPSTGDGGWIAYTWDRMPWVMMDRSDVRKGKMGTGPGKETGICVSGRGCVWKTEGRNQQWYGFHFAPKFP